MGNCRKVSLTGQARVCRTEGFNNQGLLLTEEDVLSLFRQLQMNRRCSLLGRKNRWPYLPAISLTVPSLAKVKRTLNAVRAYTPVDDIAGRPANSKRNETQYSWLCRSSRVLSRLALLPLEMESFLVVSHLTSHVDKLINNIQNRWSFLLSAFSIASHAGVFRGARKTSSPKNACVGGYI